MSKVLAIVGLFFLLAHSAEAASRMVTSELSFHVSKDSPEWLFKYTVEQGEPGSEFTTYIGSINIIDSKSRKIIQKLSIPHDKEQIHSGLPFRKDLMNKDIFQDVNFDGYQDIILFSGSYAGPNTHAAFWVYDPATKRFNYNEQLSELTSVRIDSIKHLIFSSNSCCAGHSRTDQTYRWQGNKLELIEKSIFSTSHGSKGSE
jgi:hypothetical protein